jgi:UrcA family protein
MYLRMARTRRAATRRYLPMKMHKTPGKISAVALLLMAGAFLAPSNASAQEVRTIKVAFKYYKSDGAPKIYSGFQRTANQACRDDTNRPLALRRSERVCAADLLNKVVDKLGRADVAALHHEEMTQVASR